MYWEFEMDRLSRWLLIMYKSEHQEKRCIINVMYSEIDFFLRRSQVTIVAALGSDSQMTENSEDREIY